MIRIVVPMLLLALASCSGGGEEADAGATEPVALVTLATAQQGSIAQTTTLYGAVEQGSDAQYTLSAPVEAMVDSVPAPVGTAVARGQTVVRLRASPGTRASLAVAQADFRTAQAAFARAQRLRADGLVSDADVETARAAAQGGRALLDSLSAQANGLNLRAPGPGHVASIATNPGDLVQAGTTIATLSRLGDLRARFGVEPGLARTLSPGTVLRITPSGSGTPFSAPILSIDQTIDTQTRLASIFVRVPAGTGTGQRATAGRPGFEHTERRRAHHSLCRAAR